MDISKNKTSTRKSSTKKYATFIEHNEWEGETWRFYIPIKGNVHELKALEKWINNLEDRSYELDWDPIPEKEVDILVKHSDIGYGADHNKLNGKLNWKKATENLGKKEASNEVFNDIMRNCRDKPSENDQYFEKFEVQPKKYIIFKRQDSKNTVKRTAIQYNGNEEEISKFRAEFASQIFYYDDFNMEAFCENPMPGDHVILGKFAYTNAVKKIENEKRNQYIHSELYKAGITNFVDY